MKPSTSCAITANIAHSARTKMTAESYVSCVIDGFPCGQGTMCLVRHASKNCSACFARVMMGVPSAVWLNLQELSSVQSQQRRRVLKTDRVSVFKKKFEITSEAVSRPGRLNVHRLEGLKPQGGDT